MGIGGTYFNLILGTGSEEVGKMIKRQVKNRKVNNQSYVKALYSGTKKGIGYSYKLQKKNGGYLNTLKKGFSAIPDGWKNGRGFGKLTGAIKGVGKAMPAAMAFLAVVGEVPNFIKATKEKGIGQGAKEIGKAAARLTAGALCAAIGSAIIPGVGSIAGWFVGDWIASKIVGKSYSEKAESPENQKAAPEQAADGNIVAGTGIVDGTGVGAQGYVQYPSIDINDFGPHRPYANIFFRNPAAYTDFGARMPGQEGLVGYTMAGMYPPMGFGVPNNQSPNLLTPSPGGNLLTPTGQQNAYNQQPKAENGTKLDINK